MVADQNSITGDGGPSIVLQMHAAAHWHGAAHFETSLMNGGTIETDYDVICRIEDPGSLTERYGRAMLVLDDSEWSTSMISLPSGTIAVVQAFGNDSTSHEILERLAQRPPSKTMWMEIHDPALRLLVGADDGHGSMYGYQDVPVTPGRKRCDVFWSEGELVMLIASS